MILLTIYCVNARASKEFEYGLSHMLLPAAEVSVKCASVREKVSFPLRALCTLNSHQSTNGKSECSRRRTHAQTGTDTLAIRTLRHSGHGKAETSRATRPRPSIEGSSTSGLYFPSLHASLNVLPFIAVIYPIDYRSSNLQRSGPAATAQPRGPQARALL